MQNLSHYHAIRVRYNNNGYTGRATITLKSWRFKEVVRLSYDCSRNTMEQAQEYLIKRGFNLVGYSDLEGSNDYLIFTDTFKSIKE